MSKILITDPIMVGGVTYNSVADACKVLGKKPKFVVYRLQKGWDADVAFGLKEGLTVWNSAVVINNVEYADLRHACRVLEKSEKIILDRLKRNYDLDSAFGFKKRSVKKETEVFGYTFDSQKDATLAFGVDYGRTSQRLTQYSYGKGSAFDVKDSDQPVEVNGRTYLSLLSAIEDEGVDLPTVFRRLRNGWTPDEAFGYTRKGNAPVGRFELDGIIYQTLEDAVERYGLDFWKVTYALDNGKDAESVFGVLYKTPQRNIHYGDEEQLTGFLYTKSDDMFKFPMYRGKRFDSLRSLHATLVSDGIYSDLGTARAMVHPKKGHTLGEMTKVYPRETVRGGGVSYKGDKYSSILVLCNHLDISYSGLVQARNVNPKKSLDKLVDEALARKSFDTSRHFVGDGIKYKGVEYPNAKALCEDLGLEYQQLTYAKKKNKGKVTKKMVDALIEKRDRVSLRKNILEGNLFEHEGVQYSSIDVLARRRNINPDILRKHIDKNPSKNLNDIIDLVTQKSKPEVANSAVAKESGKENTGKRRYTNRRREFDSFCKENGFVKNSIEGSKLLGKYGSGADFQKEVNLPREVAFYAHNRKEALGATIMYLLEKFEVNPNTRVEFEGRPYDSYHSLCRNFGVDVGIFSIRMHYGWTVEQSLGLTKRKVGRSSEVFVYRGVLCLGVTHITSTVLSSTSYSPPSDVSDVAKLDDFFGLK